MLGEKSRVRKNLKETVGAGLVPTRFKSTTKYLKGCAQGSPLHHKKCL